MTTLLDTITRIYKNAGGDTIGIQTVYVYSMSNAINAQDSVPYGGQAYSTANRFKRSGQVRIETSVLISSSGSRTISTVQTIGQFDSSVTVSNDIESVTYEGSSDFENDLTFPITADGRIHTIGSVI